MEILLRVLSNRQETAEPGSLKPISKSEKEISGDDASGEESTGLDHEDSLSGSLEGGDVQARERRIGGLICLDWDRLPMDQGEPGDDRLLSFLVGPYTLLTVKPTH